MNRSWLIILVLVLAFALGLCVHLAETQPPDVPFEDNYTQPSETLATSAAPSLNGKTIVNFGDSIFGNYKAPNDISSYLAQATQATVYNVAFGGCRMSTHIDEHYNAFSMHNLADAIAKKDWSLQDSMMAKTDWTPNVRFAPHLQSLKSIDFNKVDIITIAYGTNDFTGKTPLDNPANPYDTSTFGGALRYSIETISKAYPNIQIVICTPIYRFWIDKENNNAYLYDSESHVVENNKLTDFVALCKDIADEYELLCIDNYSGSGICYDNRTVCFPETSGVHPNQTGLKMIADNMAAVLLENYQ